MPEKDDTQAQIDELISIREAKRQRLGVLQVQAAQQGRDTTPHIRTEINEIEGELNRINIKINGLERSKRINELKDLEAIPTIESLTAVSIIPQTINEHLIALAAQFEGLKTETRREFRALQVAISRESEDRQRDHEVTRTLVKDEHDERVEWQATEQETRHTRQMVLSRWMWFIGFIVLLLFILFLLYATNQYLRDLYLNQAR